jgi:hypothetical protein
MYNRDITDRGKNCPENLINRGVWMFRNIKPVFYILIVALGLVLLTAGPVAANGAPVKIFLNYLPEFSNFGPTDASGQALVSIGEAWLELTVDGLPKLEGQQYQAWLITADTEEMVSLGTFDPDDNGHVEYNQQFDDLPIVEYRYFLITVEADPDTSPDLADERWSIAGLFPNTRVEIIQGTPTPTLPPGITATPGAPGGLPVTGMLPNSVWALSAGLLAVGAGIVSLVLIKRKG